MIVRDEATNLPACLASVKPIVDEIVVVDTGSTDQTVAIAQQLGAIVKPFVWCNDFAAARNESLRQATGDWVLVMDADETLVPEMGQQLRQIMQADDVLAVTLWREEVGTHLPNSLVSRLFRNRADIRFYRPYHELVDDSVQAILRQEPHWRIVELAGVAIRHTGYQVDVIKQRDKGDRARIIMQSYLAAHPADAYIANKLGTLYIEEGDIDQGLTLLEQALHQPDLELPLRYEIHYHLGITYSQLQQLDTAVRHYQKAIELPLSPTLKLGAYVNWGSLLQMQGDLARAKMLYTKLVAIHPQFAAGYLNLGVVLKGLGDLPGAIAAYQAAIQLQPNYAEAHQNLGVVWLKLGQVSDGVAAFGRAITLYEAQGSPEATRLREGLREMGF